MLRSEHTETFVKKNINNNDNSVVWEKKLYEVTKKVQMKTNDCCEHSGQETKRANVKRSKRNGGNNSDQIAVTNKKKINLKRNYWVEYWDHTNARWICTFSSKTAYLISKTYM